MKCLTFVCLVTLVSFSTAAVTKKHDRGCRYILGTCYEECPVGTHSYTTGCGPLTPEATCDEPHPVAQEGNVCDYSSCYCDPPTVRNTALKKCVPLDECPKKVPK